MLLRKLTVLSSLLFGLAILLVACEKDAEKNRTLVYAKSEIPITGAQSVPATPSGATGSLNVTYSKASQTLNYTFTWSGLTDTIRNISIMGPAPTGYATTTVKQALPGFSTSDLKTNQKNFPFQGGSYTGSVVVDGVTIKEQELLNHLYYLQIFTKPYAATGEIRAQIRFQ